MNAWKNSIQFACLAKELGIPQDYLGLETLWLEFRNFVEKI